MATATVILSNGEKLEKFPQHQQQKFFNTGSISFSAYEKIIFRATAGLGPKVLLYDIWKADSPYNQCLKELQTTDTAAKGVFKSVLVEDWTSIEQVQFCIITPKSP